MVEDSVRALRVTPRGVITDVWLHADTREQLTAMHEHLDCSLVEPVRLGDELTMWCDEEGFLAARPEANLCAFGIAARHGIISQPFVSTVLFTGAPNGDGRAWGLSPSQALDLWRECEHVNRFTVMQRITNPGQIPLDEVRCIQHECSPDAGIGAR